MQPTKGGGRHGTSAVRSRCREAAAEPSELVELPGVALYAVLTWWCGRSGYHPVATGSQTTPQIRVVPKSRHPLTTSLGPSPSAAHPPDVDWPCCCSGGAGERVAKPQSRCATCR